VTDIDGEDLQAARYSILQLSNLGDAIPTNFTALPTSRVTLMASATITTNPQPLSTTSHSRQNHLNRPRSFSSTSGAYEDTISQATRPHPNMSFSMSQGSQGSGLMMQPGGPFRQYEGSNGVHRRNSAPQIYSVSTF
jgi:hypothetical protein